MDKTNKYKQLYNIKNWTKLNDNFNDTILCQKHVCWCDMGCKC